ncbi:MAG: Rne/Rng family ribonuclease, partial [Rhodospirillales bacterium]|nr:Rne/Rng family ribonuclease [Rhodospirillales bacterium]
RMLIDASHPEETRVVIVNGNRLEDFDVEVESRKQIKGNIYLAKVTRVEPSLQAAFVDYGGNRHGFLAFNEIHPDYYQIPVEDRAALMAEVAKETSEEQDEESHDFDGSVETLGGDDTDEFESRRPNKMRRNYRIQEVVKRGQILLIQVVKEERGGKGAALTTYLSLAGRYCVLMPNTARGGGISRKISNSVDRKRLKTIINELGIPGGIAVIVRTAGAKRSKAEIKRDYEYLLRLWTQIRETTLESIAPATVHEEGNLIKRSIRDLYTKDIEEVVVAGDEGYRMAKDFMKLLIPSHAKRVQPFKDEGMSLTQRYQVESQLAAIHSPDVHMKSGGYIVINPTEALVSIDVNSGKATKERNIEETALKTNLEAADEIARQLKLRDLAGLIVIDFIDMEVSRNQARVERQLKDAMRNDRARIQIGRISPFGLLELSRQRLRPSLLETSSEPCPHCAGTGVRRSTDSTALHILRMIEDECTHRKADDLTLFVPTAVALYLLNFKRSALADIEARYETRIVVHNDDTLIPPDCRIERNGDVKTIEHPKLKPISNSQPVRTQTAEDDDEQSEDGGKRRKRRRGRRRKRSDNDNTEAAEDNTVQAEATVSAEGEEPTADDGDDSQVKRRRRGRRGGRNRGRKPEDTPATEAVEAVEADESAPQADTGSEAVELPAPPPADNNTVIALGDQSAAVDESTAAEDKPKRRRRRRSPGAEADASDTAEPVAVQVIPITAVQDPDTAADGETVADTEVAATKPARKSRRKPAARKVAVETDSEAAAPDTAASEQPSDTQTADTATLATDEAPKPKRRRRVKPATESTEPPKETPSEPEAVVALVAEEAPTVAAIELPAPIDVVVESVEPEQEPAAPAIEDAPAPVEEKPTKRGWWRR